MGTDQTPPDNQNFDQITAVQTNANRVVLLVAATACMFGFTTYFQDGTWIFPFPLYEIGMAISIAVLFTVGRSKPDFAAYLVISWAFLQLVTSQFVLEIFFGGGELKAIFDSYFLDIAYGLFCMTFLAWGIAISSRVESPMRRKSAIVAFVLFAAMYLVSLSPYLQYHVGLLENDSSAAFAENLVYFAAIPLLSALGLLLTTREKLQPHLHILVLFSFFYVTKYGTLLFFGS